MSLLQRLQPSVTEVVNDYNVHITVLKPLIAMYTPTNISRPDVYEMFYAKLASLAESVFDEISI